MPVGPDISTYVTTSLKTRSSQRKCTQVKYIPTEDMVAEAASGIVVHQVSEPHHGSRGREYGVRVGGTRIRGSIMDFLLTPDSTGRYGDV
jgi:hypothetical protein